MGGSHETERRPQRRLRIVTSIVFISLPPPSYRSRTKNCAAHLLKAPRHSDRDCRCHVRRCDQHDRRHDTVGNDFGWRPGGSPLGGLLMMSLAPIAALLIRMAISRSREFAADEGGAQMAGGTRCLLHRLRAHVYDQSAFRRHPGVIHAAYPGAARHAAPLIFPPLISH